MSELTTMTIPEDVMLPVAQIGSSNDSTSSLKNISLELEDDIAAGEAGIHSIVKNTDYWFNREVGQLEQFALAQARSHAEAGVPRQNAPVTEILPIETVLHDRSVQILLEWRERVKRRFQDGIQRAGQKAGAAVVQLRHALDQFELNELTTRDCKDKLRDLEKRTAGVERPMEYERLLHSAWYWPVFVLLICVDWIANVPVFSELLPHEVGEGQRWAERVATAVQQHPGTSGIWIEFYKVLFSPGATLLAIGVVVSLMFLGHICGMTLRRLMAFRQDDEIGTVLGLKSSRRQSFLPSVASGVGMLVVIFVLFYSRHLLEPITQARVNAVQSSIDKLKQAGPTSADIANTDEDVQTQRLQTQKDDLQEHADYAGSITAMNVPISLLNLVLGITAVAASYLHDKAKILETRLVDPRIAQEESKLRALREEMIGFKNQIRSLDLEVQEQLATAKYLATADPFMAWPAKARRVEAIVPLFRSENARERGIDVQNIEQFKRPPVFPLPSIEAEEPFNVPEGIGLVESEYGRLHAHIVQLNKREQFHLNGSGEGAEIAV